MTVEALIQELQQENCTPWQNQTSTNPLSIKNFLHHLTLDAQVPGGGEKAAMVRLLWGNVVDDIFAERFRDRSISEKTHKKYWDDFCNASDKALKNIRWLHETLLEQASENPAGLLDAAAQNLRQNFPVFPENRSALQKTAAIFGFSCLYDWYYGKENAPQDIWSNPNQSLTQLERAYPEYLHAVRVMLAEDPHALLARCVFAVSAQCWDAEEQSRRALLRRCWLPDDEAVLAMAAKSREAACYGARYFHCMGKPEQALQAAVMALEAQTEPAVGHLLLDDDLVGLILGSGSGGDRRLLRALTAELAQRGDGCANCLTGRALYHHWQGECSDATWLKEFLPETNTEQADALAWKHFELALRSSSENQPLQAQCLFYMGKIREAQGQSQAAADCYKKASVLGGANDLWAEKAEKAQRGSRLLTLTRGSVRTEEVYAFPLTSRPSNYVFLMGTTMPYQEFIRTLPLRVGGWNIIFPNTPKPPDPACCFFMPCSAPNRLYTVCRDVSWSVRQLLMNSDTSDGIPRMMFALFGDDQEENVRQVTDLMASLSENLAVIRDRSYARRIADFRRALSGIRVYVSVESEYCANLLDSMLQMLFEKYEFYIPLNIINRYTHAAQQLFSQFPLFTPFIGHAQPGAPLDLVVFGTGQSAMAVVREAMALPVSGHPMVIHVVGENAGGAERRFRQSCPAMRRESWLNDYVNVKFYHCPLDELPLYGPEEDDALAQAISRGVYFVAAADQDSVNVELGIRLRESLLARGDNDYSAAPIIAARCADSMGAFLMEHMRAQNKGGSDKWYAGYRILKFGTSEIFSWEELENGLVEARAKAIHLSYCCTKTEDEAQRYQGLQDYYLRYYNRSSSRSTAVGLAYRAFDAGVYLDPKLYGDRKNEAVLGKQYQQWLYGANGEPDPGHLEQAARAEQIRWCLQIASRGWQSASLDQMKAYTVAGNPGHQLHIAKLHPYFVPWEKLGDVYEQMTGQYRICFSRIPKDPRITTKESVQASASFFEEVWTCSAVEPHKEE